MFQRCAPPLVDLGELEAWGLFPADLSVLALSAVLGLLNLRSVTDRLDRGPVHPAPGVPALTPQVRCDP